MMTIAVMPNGGGGDRMTPSFQLFMPCSGATLTVSIPVTATSEDIDAMRAYIDLVVKHRFTDKPEGFEEETE